MKSKIQHLREIPLLRNLSESEVLEIATCMSEVTVDRGTVLFRIGEDSDAAYFIINGELSAFLQTTEQVQEILKIGNGSVFGELCLVKPGKRSLTIRANTNCILLRIDRTRFSRLRDQRASSAYRVIRNICVTACDRLRSTNQFIEVEVERGEHTVPTVGGRVSGIQHMKRKVLSLFGGRRQ